MQYHTNHLDGNHACLSSPLSLLFEHTQEKIIPTTTITTTTIILYYYNPTTSMLIADSTGNDSKQLRGIGVAKTCEESIKHGIDDEWDQIQVKNRSFILALLFLHRD